MTEFHTVKPIDNSRLVRRAAPNRMREMARLVALGALVALVAFLYAWQHFEYIQLRYQLESLEVERAQATELNQEFKLEVAGLQRACADRCRLPARQLGLTAPVPGQVAPFEGPSEAGDGGNARRRCRIGAQ